MLQFYESCDGFDAGLADSVCGDVLALERALSRLPVGKQSRLFPLRSDGCGNFDCIVLGTGTCEGAVVFWDHEVYDRPAYLLGGCLTAYLEHLIDKLVHEFLPTGERDARYVPSRIAEWPFIGESELSHPWPFDERWLGSRDPDAARLLADPFTRRWLARQDELNEAG